MVNKSRNRTGKIFIISFFFFFFVIHVVLLDFNYIENNAYFYILHWVYNQPTMSSLHVFLTSHVIVENVLDLRFLDDVFLYGHMGANHLMHF